MNRLDRNRRLFAIALAGLAGFVDAAGFLSADGYFVSFMSGNTTRLGVNLATDPARASIPALLIAGFVLGVAAGGIVAGVAGRWRKLGVLGLVTLCLLVAALSRSAGAVTGSVASMVIAMGALNATFQRGGEAAIGLTYMTGALVRMGQGLAAAILGRPRGNWQSFLALWSGLAAGAVGGALAWSRWEAGCLWLAVAWAAAMALVALRLPAEA